VLIAHPAHLDPPVDPGDLWTSWNLDIPLCLGLVVALVLGRRHPVFLAAIITLAVALVSPLDALASSLASAHMAQHLLLTTIAAPLLALSAGTLLERFSSRSAWTRTCQNPIAWAIVHTVVLWAWHAAALYEAALSNDVLHRLEHVTFLATATLAWAAILARGAAGLGVLVLFGLSVQSALLGVLMTFAPTPWYPTYAGRTEAWGLSPIADQQLAGVIMWVPGGGAYLVAALALLAMLVTDSPRPAVAARR
jgi:cytochrome c oxidase assembly factor CtaG